MKNIFETIKQEAELRGVDKAALKDGRNELSYSTLFQRVESAAEGLRGQGVAKGLRVALFCGDSIDYVISSLAVLALRAVVIPVSPSSAEHEVDALLERIGADFLLFDQALCTREGSPVAAGQFVEKKMLLAELEGGETPAGFTELNPAFVRFSSGTTGQSKGVLLSHEAIVERTDAADKGLQITSDDTVLWVLSMSYHFVVSILLFLRRGATICLCYDHFPLALLDSVKVGEGTFIYASPFHYYAMCESSGFAPDSLKNIRMAISTSMKLPDDTASAFAEKFGFELTEAYGIIEVGLPFLNRAADGARGSVGRILPDYEIKLLNEDEEGIGEIFIRGKGMFNAYVSPWKIFPKDDWFNAGDLGRIDENGNLFIAGRKKGLINFMGMKVFPGEVEAVLNAHPCVKESLVYGEPHPRYGQLPCARVVRCGDIDAMALKRYCLGELSPQKAPKSISFVERLPKTPSGKLRRNATMSGGGHEA
ncbi:MAG: acyl--CoA ligase [Kiritimatiellales bacterium]|nr:acyl--CoA ligase [Kiritimatiellales bacterium]